MRRSLALALLLSTLTACGDDGKTAPRGAPQAPPAAATPAPGALPTAPDPYPGAPAPAPAAEGSPWLATRVGDSATWEIRVIGAASVTKLTWRATRVDAAGVRYAVQARTLDVEGSTKSLVESEEFHAHGAAAPAGGVAEALTVAGRSIATTRSSYGDGAARTTVWTAKTVPFSGLVRSTNPDVEQTLVAFNRGP